MELKNQIVLEGNELTIREGKAADPLPLKEPKILAISGDIHSVSNFLRERQSGHSSQAVDKNKAVVTVDKTARTIMLQLDPENHYGATIAGKLELSPELAQFGINQEKRYNRQSLVNLLKFNRFYFEDKNAHAALLQAFYKLRIKSETELQQERDNAGNGKNSVEIKVVEDSGFPRTFVLTVPIFKGFPAQKIEVEICFEVLDGAISFWLESIGLKEVIDSSIDEIFSEELKSCAGFVVINK